MSIVSFLAVYVCYLPLFFFLYILLPVNICHGWVKIVFRENALVYPYNKLLVVCQNDCALLISFFLSTPTSRKLCCIIVSNRKNIYVLQLFFKMNLVMPILCCQSVWFFKLMMVNAEKVWLRTNLTWPVFMMDEVIT